jgi:hypothetical protein
MLDAGEILKELAAGRFFLSVHAACRMMQRSVTKADIQNCGRTANKCIYQPDAGTYRIEGKDLDGDRLTVICGIDDAVAIVTIF